ncbi:MAG: ATP-dependent RecD-like DNA helicase, partial [Candidatus Aminicenantales bacterium]
MEYFEGTIDQIIYYSPENGYTVCKFNLENGQTVTVVGSFPPLSPGEVLKISGQWEINPKFGKQFRVENFLPILPSTIKGVEKFLSSGLIKGIGPVLAQRIIKKFGLKTIDILSKRPQRLKEVEGIGTHKIEYIKKSWQQHQKISDLIIFLQEHNVSTTLAIKIYHQYGDDSFRILKTNPYQVCHDIWGIGFKTADQMALKLGLSPDSLERVKAYIYYLLEKDTEQRHVFSLTQDIKREAQRELEVEEKRIEEALAELEKDKLIVTEELDGQRAIYLPFYYRAQEEVVRCLHELASFPFLKPPFDVDEAIIAAEEQQAITFSDLQKLAIRESLLKKILVITGGPGTGKTTIIKAIVDIFHKWGRKVLLAAPTGRAAKRLSEATQKEAKTIHRILEYNPKEGSFKRNKDRPLSGDALVIDEFSMVDIPLMYYLLQAVPPWMRLILVGDKDQLPSVGPGNLLKDIIESKQVEVVRLNEIFRQEKDSLIVLNAHRVNQGQSLIYPPRGDKDSDFYFIHQEDEQKVFKTIINLCAYRLPKKLDLPPLSTQIQVISPMYRGLIGVDNLNSELQSRLNPFGQGLKLGARQLKVHDKVMQIKNNYEKEIFNGDIGIVVYVDKPSYRIGVDFDGRVIFYEKEEMNEITLAYAVSVHKAQGSEFQAVVMPLLPQHF